MNNTNSGTQSCNDATSTEEALTASDQQDEVLESTLERGAYRDPEADGTEGGGEEDTDDRLAHNEVMIFLKPEDTEQTLVTLDEHGCYYVEIAPPFPRGTDKLANHKEWYPHARYTHYDALIRVTVNRKHVHEAVTARKADFDQFEATLEYGVRDKSGKKVRWGVHAPVFYAIDTKHLALSSKEAVKVRNPLDNPEDPKLSALAGYPVAYEDQDGRLVPPFEEGEVIANLVRVGRDIVLAAIDEIHQTIVERKLAVSEKRVQKFTGGAERERPKDLPVAGGETFTPKGKKAKREHAAKQAAKGAETSPAVSGPRLPPNGVVNDRP